MTRFLIDAQLPPALARWLVAKGFEAQHVGDRGLATATDLVIWSVAREGSWVIISKDRDFAQLRAASKEGPPVVWVRIVNTRRAALLPWFDRVLPALVTALESGETLVELT